MKVYDDYYAGKIIKHELSEAQIQASIAKLSTPEI